MAEPDDVAPDMVAMHAQTAAIYDEAADGYDAHRCKILIEKPWLDRFLAALPSRPQVLDVGCGSGDPVGRYLISQGCRLTGLDIAPGMLAIARGRFPQAEWLLGDMRRPSLDRRFDGIVSWDGFFHLSRREQTDTIPKLAAYIRPGGALMLTVGDADGEITGTVEGHTVYHASLAIDAYQELLRQAGFQSIDYRREDPTCDFHSVLLASDLATGDPGRR